MEYRGILELFWSRETEAKWRDWADKLEMMAVKVGVREEDAKLVVQALRTDIEGYSTSLPENAPVPERLYDTLHRAAEALIGVRDRTMGVLEAVVHVRRNEDAPAVPGTMIRGDAFSDRKETATYAWVDESGNYPQGDHQQRVLDATRDFLEGKK